MNTSLTLAENLRALLGEGDLRGDPLTARQLQTATAMSQPSISLALAQLGSDVCKLGAARSTRYALTQPILGLAAQQAITYTTTSGTIQTWGTLTYLRCGQVHVRSVQGGDWLGQSGELPWFLQPLRPQGFLGRQLTRLRPDFPTDPDRWTVEQVLYMAINHAVDPPGALNLGERLGRLMNEVPVAFEQRPSHYDMLALAVTKMLPAHSSAGGEQLKFITETPFNPHPAEHHHFIVKFTPPRGTPFGERWHDLLHLEQLALQVLSEHGVAVAATRILESNQRTYLESQRFDRIGVEGKRHVIAAASVHDAFVKSPRRHWVATCQALAAQKLLSAAHVKEVASIYLFGQYIGNTDMHFCNLSFFVDDLKTPVFISTPVYDMLPMMWRPGVHGGELEPAALRAQPQPGGFEVEAGQARAWAAVFWRRASQLGTISPILRDASAANAALLT